MNDKQHEVTITILKQREKQRDLNGAAQWLTLAQWTSIVSLIALTAFGVSSGFSEESLMIWGFLFFAVSILASTVGALITSCLSLRWDSSVFYLVNSATVAAAIAPVVIALAHVKYSFQ